MRKHRVAAIAATLGATAAVVAFAVPASAASPREEVCTYKFTTTVSIYKSASSSSTVLGHGSTGQVFTSAPYETSGSYTHGTGNSITGWVLSKDLGSQTCRTAT